MKNKLDLRFYAELNDFLPNSLRKNQIEYNFFGHPAVKDVIESQGIPHTEVDLILVNGISVGFDYQVKDGDRISVYPMFESFDIRPLYRLRPQPLREPRFVLDNHLGKLATYLRFMGFDSKYQNDWDDSTLADISSEEDRTLLTRDIGLLKRGQIQRGYWIRCTGTRNQLIEVIRRFDLINDVRMFTRCSLCNGLINPVPVDSIRVELLNGVFHDVDQFFRCENCGQIYWQGSHTDRISEFLSEVLEEAKYQVE